MGRYTEVAEALRHGKKAVLVHSNADVDAIGSAYALYRCFPDCTICACGGVDYVANVFAEKLKIPMTSEYDPSDYDLTVVVDTSSPELLCVTVPDNSLVIDHHIPTSKWDGMRFFCNSESVSCCEIIVEIIHEAGAKIDRETGLALLGGMLTDSGHFQFSKSNTLRHFADVMDESGVAMDEAMSTTHAEIRMSERTAVLKTMERVKFERVGDMIVASAVGSSFEASACRAVTSAGADVVFVGTQRDDFFRVSARATQDMVRRGINLGEVLKDIGSEIECDGGGHIGAAGLSGIGDVEAVLGICVYRTMDSFRKIKAQMGGGPEI
ncbi:MAG: DHH family phosphoesterase [Methanomassiliicoccaceae archaeon]|nr:DHH family phosphoesterase [Methanomassiliicoccaceae archaeon]